MMRALAIVHLHLLVLMSISTQSRSSEYTYSTVRGAGQVPWIGQGRLEQAHRDIWSFPCGGDPLATFRHQDESCVCVNDSVVVVDPSISINFTEIHKSPHTFVRQGYFGARLLLRLATEDVLSTNYKQYTIDHVGERVCQSLESVKMPGRLNYGKVRYEPRRLDGDWKNPRKDWEPHEWQRHINPSLNVIKSTCGRCNDRRSLVYYTAGAAASLTDKMVVLERVSNMASALCAKVMFAEPCKLLSVADNNGKKSPCGHRWNRYFKLVFVDDGSNVIAGTQMLNRTIVYESDTDTNTNINIDTNTNTNTNTHTDTNTNTHTHTNTHTNTNVDTNNTNTNVDTNTNINTHTKSNDGGGFVLEDAVQISRDTGYVSFLAQFQRATAAFAAGKPFVWKLVDDYYKFGGLLGDEQADGGVKAGEGFPYHCPVTAVQMSNMAMRVRDGVLRSLGLNLASDFITLHVRDPQHHCRYTVESVSNQTACVLKRWELQLKPRSSSPMTHQRVPASGGNDDDVDDSDGDTDDDDDSDGDDDDGPSSTLASCPIIVFSDLTVDTDQLVDRLRRMLVHRQVFSGDKLLRPLLHKELHVKQTESDVDDDNYLVLATTRAVTVASIAHVELQYQHKAVTQCATCTEPSHGSRSF